MEIGVLALIKGKKGYWAYILFDSITTNGPLITENYSVI